LVLARGAEMGRFRLGSTVILLFPAQSIGWRPGYASGSPTRMGEALADFLAVEAPTGEATG
jgi:phosphatidylserine decarboxylase